MQALELPKLRYSPFLNFEITFFFSSQHGSGVSRKTPPSAKQHYMKQARYFSGQKMNAQPQQTIHNQAVAPTFTGKASYGATGGNAMGGHNYVPSFGTGMANRGVGVGRK